MTTLFWLTMAALLCLAAAAHAGDASEVSGKSNAAAGARSRGSHCASAVPSAVSPLRCPASTERSPRETAVGAIRWDAWVAGSEWERNLGPPQWRDRLPFYGREVAPNQVQVRGDTQDVMDAEIGYAAGAGLDYWAFCYSHPAAGQSVTESYGLRLYLSSQRQSELSFCLILMAQGYNGPKEEYARAVEAFVGYFKQPTYQQVLGGRPLLYIFYVEQMPRYFGSDAAAREALDQIRQAAVKAGLAPPYIVAQVFSAQTGADYVDRFGFDAISAYAIINFTHGDTEYPYSTLAQANRDYWEACKATGKQVIPIVNAGWDNRPRRADEKRFIETYQHPGGAWYTQPTPTELADHLRSALEWNRRNRAHAEANAVIIYAWNESDEGGWLLPTHAEGTARLDAIRRVLRPQP